MIHFCIVTLGSDDLLELALASIEKYVRTPHTVATIHLPLDTDDPRAHGRAIDEWRSQTRGLVWGNDLVCVMDPDVAILSEFWEREVLMAFVDSSVGIWGAGSREDFGPRVHASMMVIRGKLWNANAYATFMPLRDPCEPWRDTGGHFCHEATLDDWKLKPVERSIADWQADDFNRGGFSGWRAFDGTPPEPFMWTHLGGGSHSDPARMTWYQRVWRDRAVQERERWKRLVRENLNDS